MPIESRYILVASMAADAIPEDLFNTVYDEHIEFISKVPGVRSITRLRGEAFGIAIGGTVASMSAPDPLYTAIYEIDDPKVLESPEWSKACEAGRWPSEVRPHTRNRKHAVYKVL